MSSKTLEILKKTVPESLHNEVIRIFESTKPAALAVATVIMKLWSQSMFRHAEDLIFNKAIQENFFEEGHRKFINVFQQDVCENDEADWVIPDQDEIIVELLWDVFCLRQLYYEIHTHRLFVQKCYDRIKDFIPEVHPEIIERHNLSKYAFSQAIGYALKFVHGIYNPVWIAACDLHLQNEPHHPKTWSKEFTPAQKKCKLEEWCRHSCHTETSCSYGHELATHNFESEELPVPFLWESYIDMMAVEWRKKKGQRTDTSISELIYMDEKYLMRYSNRQRKMILALVNRVIASDNEWMNTSANDREKTLLATVPEKERGSVIFRLITLKKYGHSRQRGAELPVAGNSSVYEEHIKKAADLAFYNTLASVVLNTWSNRYRKYIEHLILRRAIKEKYIREEHLKWIFFAEKFDDEDVDKEPTDTTQNSYQCEEIVNLIWNEFNMREHFSQMKEHRFWIMKSYHRLAKFVPEVPEEIIDRHDLSKFAFSQAVGYTLRWVHNINLVEWKKACELHLNAEPHHPQMWSRRHSPEYKQSCLEAFLCLDSRGAKYGIKINEINTMEDNMALVFLLESFIDMVGIEWERKKNKRNDLTNSEIIYMDEKYLTRYSEHDKAYLLRFMQKIRDEDNLALEFP